MGSIYLFFGGILFSVIVYFLYWLFTDDKSNAIIKNLEQELKELRKKHLDLLNDYRTLYSKYLHLDKAYDKFCVREQAIVADCNARYVCTIKQLAEKDKEIASLKKSFDIFANSCRGMYEIDGKSPFILKIGGSRHTCNATRCEVSRDIINPNKSEFTISGRISESVYTKMPDSFADTLKIVSDNIDCGFYKSYHINEGRNCFINDDKNVTRFSIHANRPIDVCVKVVQGKPIDVVSVKDSNGINSQEYVVRGDGIF